MNAYAQLFAAVLTCVVLSLAVLGILSGPLIDQFTRAPQPERAT